MTKKLPTDATELGKCPCGGEIGVGIGGDPCVLHTEPTCAEFDALGPVEFLAYVRRSRGLAS